MSGDNSGDVSGDTSGESSDEEGGPSRIPCPREEDGRMSATDGEEEEKEEEEEEEEGRGRWEEEETADAVDAEGGGGEVEEEEGEEDNNNIVCELCQSGGDLICCEKCPAVYHCACLGKTMEDLPEDYICARCDGTFDAVEESFQNNGGRVALHGGGARGGAVEVTPPAPPALQGLRSSFRS